MSNQKRKAKKIKEKYEQKWMAIEGVSAVGIGVTGNQMIGIIISVTENPEEIRHKIPAKIKEIPIKIQKTGKFKAN